MSGYFIGNQQSFEKKFPDFSLTFSLKKSSLTFPWPYFSSLFSRPGGNPAKHNVAQLRTNKSPFLTSYQHNVDTSNHTTPLCPLYNIQEHDTAHLFTCTKLYTHTHWTYGQTPSEWSFCWTQGGTDYWHSLWVSWGSTPKSWEEELITTTHE